MGANDYYYGSATDRKGPVSAEQLKVLFGQRRLPPTTQVWSEGMAQWVPATSIPFLQQVLRTGYDNAGMGLVLPVGPQSGFAIAAGYLGLLSIFVLPAPVAIAFGILGLKDIKKHPEKAGKGRSITGIVLGTVFGLAGLAMLASIKH
jgi:hypothetical protein